MSAELEKQLRVDEGSSRWAYLDSRKLWTIAIGRLCDSRFPSSGLNDEEQSYLFNNDVARTLREAEAEIPWIHELDQVRLDAILNMCFQMGASKVATFVNSLKLLRAKQYGAAADNFMKSLWAQQTPARAARITKQIRTGVYQFS